MVPPSALGYLAMDPDSPLPYAGSSRMISDVSPAGIDPLAESAGPGSGSTLASVELRSLGGALGRRTPGHGARANQGLVARRASEASRPLGGSGSRAAPRLAGA
jgi:hypothetical protein